MFPKKVFGTTMIIPKHGTVQSHRQSRFQTLKNRERSLQASFLKNCSQAALLQKKQLPHQIKYETKCRQPIIGCLFFTASRRTLFVKIVCLITKHITPERSICSFFYKPSRKGGYYPPALMNFLFNVQ